MKKVIIYSALIIATGALAVACAKLAGDMKEIDDLSKNLEKMVSEKL